MWFAIEIAI